MSRYGKPMYSAQQYANIFVTLEDGRVKHWTGRSCKSIQKSARAKYPGQKLAFGKCFYRTR